MIKPVWITGMLIVSIMMQPPLFAEENANSATTVMTKASAKLAQAKARIRAYGADIEGVDADTFTLSPLNTTGCDINIGNMVLNNHADAPEEVIIFIEGDIIQSNRCR